MNEYGLEFRDEIILIKTEIKFDINEWLLIETTFGNYVLKIVKVGKVSNFTEEGTLLRKAEPREVELILKEEKELNLIKSYCQSSADSLKLKMKILKVYENEKNNEYKIIFYADNRVDFRELGKKMSGKYRKRIEFRQIGARDKSQKVGGIGTCGLILCCSAYLKSFDPISINMAKNQMIALNPNKINGQCGRLLCCLGYEDETYTEIRKNMPKLGTFVKTKHGDGKVIEINVIKNSYTIQKENNERIEVAGD